MNENPTTKDLLITISFVAGEAPGAESLKSSGMTLRDYASSILDEMELGDLSNYEPLNVSARIVNHE